MIYNFDAAIDRRCSESAKWHFYDDDVLPLWVADTDFASPEPVIRALRERVEHGVFGYPNEPPELREVIQERLLRLYGWRVAKEAIVFVPGIVVGFNLAIQAMGQPGEGVLIQPPVYPPFLGAPTHAGMLRQDAELPRLPDGAYGFDAQAFEAAVTERTRIFLLCNPHNPVGRPFRRDELLQMAETCARHDLTIISDEIHCDLLFDGVQHIPMAALDPAIEARTVTLMAPSKTYNIAGLECSAAIIPNPELRRRYEAARRGISGGVNVLGLIAGLAAYREGQEWLDQMLSYLQANRDFLYDYVAANLPGIQMHKPTATFLAWLDCRQAGLPEVASEFFVKHARVGMNDGATFGPGGSGFVRLNFGCTRVTLTEALERMRRALAAK